MNYIKIIFFVFGLATLNCFASDSFIKNKSKDFSLSLLSTFENGNIQPKIALGWYLSDDFQLRTAFGLVNKNSTEKDPLANGPDKINSSTGFFIEPNIRLNFLSSSRSILYFVTGINLKYSFSNQQHQFFNNTDPEIHTSEYNVKLLAGMGAEYFVSKELAFSLETHLSYSTIYGTKSTIANNKTVAIDLPNNTETQIFNYFNLNLSYYF